MLDCSNITEKNKREIKRVPKWILYFYLFLSLSLKLKEGKIKSNIRKEQRMG